MSATKRPKAPVENLGLTHVDKWPEGLQIGFKSLSQKTVKRAASVHQVVAVCARHNLRKNNEGHRHRRPIDPERTRRNWVLEGDACPEAVAAAACGTVAALGLMYPRRVDAVAAFEVVIQPPHGFDTAEFWGAAMDWVHSRYEHVLSAVVHRDQKRPHAHIVALPVLGGRLAGRVMQRDRWGVPRLRHEFLVHMRGALGLCPGVQESPLTKWALATGAGPSSHDAAARRDAALDGSAKRALKRGDVERGHQANVPRISGPMSSNGHTLPGGWWAANGRDLCWLMMAC
jgi:hypothetical protein